MKCDHPQQMQLVCVPGKGQTAPRYQFRYIHAVGRHTDDPKFWVFTGLILRACAWIAECATIVSGTKSSISGVFHLLHQLRHGGLVGFSGTENRFFVIVAINLPYFFHNQNLPLRQQSPVKCFLSFGSGVGCGPVRIAPLFPCHLTLLLEQLRLALEFLFVDFAFCKLRRPTRRSEPRRRDHLSPAAEAGGDVCSADDLNGVGRKPQPYRLAPHIAQKRFVAVRPVRGTKFAVAPRQGLPCAPLHFLLNH